MYVSCKQRLGILGVLIVILGAVWIAPLLHISTAAQSYLTVTFLSVGQGDAILIETPDGVQALIDGGPDATVLRELTATLPWFDRTLDLILSTHPDKDHIGGLVDVLQRYKVATIISTENTGETLTAANFHKALNQEGAGVVMARAGQIYQLGASTTLTIFSPANDPSMLESNTASIVAQLHYGDIDFMLTGDAPESIERYLVGAYGNQLKSEVLKLGHHGSKNSSSDEFLTVVAPNYAVVSAGKDNTYGHPSPETVARVRDHNIPIVSTIDEGRITFESDGKTVWEVK